MPRLHVAVAACVIASCFSAAAADVETTVERPLTPNVASAPAPADQTNPSVASNGRSFIAVWQDRRRGVADVYCSRLDRDGKPLDPYGRRLATGAFSPVIASDGNQYLVAFQTATAVGIVRLDRDANVLGTSFVGGPDSTPRFLVSNGSTFLLVVTEQFGNQRATVLLLNAAGAVLSTLFTTGGDPVGAAVRDGGYVLVDYTWTHAPSLVTAHPLLHTITPAGATSTTALPELTGPSTVYPVAAFGPDSLLIAWGSSMTTVEPAYLVASYAGNVIRQPTALGATDAAAGSVVPSALWDGREFLLSVQGTGARVVVRIAPDGTVADATPAVLAARGGPPAFASAGGVQMLVWADARFSSMYGDIVARAISGSDELFEFPDRANLVSWSGAAQTDVAIARTGSHEAAVWTSPDTTIAGSVDGVAFAIAKDTATTFVTSPAIGAARDQFLVCWEERERTGAARLLAERVAVDGRVVDAAPLLVWESPFRPTFFSDRPSIASDGSNFFITWAAGDAFLSMIEPSGVVQTHTVLAAAVLPSPWDRVESPQLAWRDGHLFLGYRLGRPTFGDTYIVPPSAISGFPVDASRDAPVPGALAFDPVAGGVEMRMAAGADGVTFVWSDSGRDDGWPIAAAQTTFGGAPVTSPHRIAVRPLASCSLTPPVIAWNGTEYVVAWTEMTTSCARGDVRVVRLNRFAQAIDAQPITIATDVLPYTPSVAASEEGVVVAFSRADDAIGGAPRAFEITVKRSAPSIPRRRASH